MDWLHIVLAVFSTLSTMLGIVSKSKEGKTRKRLENRQKLLDVVIDGVERYSAHASTKAAKIAIKQKAVVSGVERDLRVAVKARTR